MLHFSSFFLLPATKSEKNICPRPIGQHSDSLKFPVAHDVCACPCTCVYVHACVCMCVYACVCGDVIHVRQYIAVYHCV